MGGFVYILGPSGVSPTKFPVRLGVSPATSIQVFSVRDFEALFPWAGTLGCVVCLTPQLFLVYLHADMGLPSTPAATSPALVLRLQLCLVSSPPRLPVSAPPTRLDECFFFNSLFVVLLYCLIFWQLWLFFVFKFVVVLLLVVWGGKLYLPMPPSWQEVPCSIFEVYPYCSMYQYFISFMA